MGVEFIDNSEQVKADLESAIIAGLIEAAGEIKSQAIRNSRRDTTDTAGSFKTHVDESTLTAFIGSDNINALYEEFGTGEYALDKSKSKRSVWYVPVEKVTGKRKPTFHGRVVVIEKDGKKYYKTNGKKPTRALWNAFKTKKAAVKRILQHRVNEALKKYGS